MKRYVVDASVILKWVLGDREEHDHEKATELLNAWAEGRVELLAPTLWEYEVGNFLGREFPEEAMARMSRLLDLGLKGLPLSRYHGVALLWLDEGKPSDFLRCRVSCGGG